MERIIILYALPLFALAVLLDFIVDIVKKTNRYRVADSITSLSVGFLGTTIGLLSVGFVGFFYKGAFDWAHLFDFDDSILTWVLAAIVYDGLYYWYHRAHHRINICWASHATHHNSEYLNFTTALRQSAFGFLTVWPFFLPMGGLGFTYEQFLFGAGLSVLYGFFTHTENVRFVPFLEYVFVGPSSHRVHHGINPAYIDKNYGSILNIWDHIFGTYAFENVEDPVRYGTITPLNSFNPFWANLSVYWFLLKDAFLCKRWSDKLIIWFKKTGWRPTDRKYSSPIISGAKRVQSFKKFDFRINYKEFYYCGFNFVLAAFATVYIMLYAKSHFMLWNISYISLLWMLLLANSFILGEKRYRFLFEYIRLFITGILAYVTLNALTSSIDVTWFRLIFVISTIQAVVLTSLYCSTFVMETKAKNI